MIALLYNVHVVVLSLKRVRITLEPNRLGRWLRRRTRVGIAVAAPDDDGCKGWWWQMTDSYVGDYIENYIAAAPILSIEDMSVEQLLTAGDSNDGARTK
jgi:hypothetical protein